MFEVGFGEILMLGLVTLLVVGPEQLPKVARTAGLWIGKARRMLASIQADIERDIKAEELKDLLSRQTLSSPIEELLDDTRETLRYPLNNPGRIIIPQTTPTIPQTTPDATPNTELVDNSQPPSLHNNV